MPRAERTVDAQFCPRLRHCTLVEDIDAGNITLVVGKDLFSLERHGDREKFLKFKSYFDGRHSIAEIARRTDVSLASAIGIVEAFQGAGLLQRRTAISWIDAGEFRERVEDSSIMWRRQIGLHRLFGGLSGAIYREEVFLGLLIEVYHYVRMLPRALIKVAGQMKCASFKEAVDRYAEEELEHYKEFLAALQRVDRLAGQLETAHPTVGTLSLIRNFESIGHTSELSLICCLQLIEARRSEMDEAETDFRKIAKNYGYEHLIEPYLRHMRQDVELEHSNILDMALRSTQDIRADDAHAAVNDMHDVKHAFDAFHDSIIQYYEDISNYIPRVRVDYFAL